MVVKRTKSGDGQLFVRLPCLLLLLLLLLFLPSKKKKKKLQQQQQEIQLEAVDRPTDRLNNDMQLCVCHYSASSPDPNHVLLLRILFFPFVCWRLLLLLLPVTKEFSISLRRSCCCRVVPCPLQRFDRHNRLILYLKNDDDNFHFRVVECMSCRTTLLLLLLSLL